jgi:RNA polymerase sigma factor (sigma-70 family)
LIRAANAGDEAAWGAIVERFAGLVWATARAHRLAPAEAADVVQTTWLRLVENLDRINDPERVGAWLATTARRECLRHIRLQGRELPTGDDALFEAPTEALVEQRLITRERNAALRRGFARISERCQALLRLLAATEPLSYEEIGAALGMPVGAIGPTRSRCLDQLRRTPELAGLQIG